MHGLLFIVLEADIAVILTSGSRLSLKSTCMTHHAVAIVLKSKRKPFLVL